MRLVVFFIVFLISGCSALSGYSKSTDHGEMPILDDKEKELIERSIKSLLKDPDSLKNLEVSSYMKCYLRDDYFLTYIDGSESWCAIVNYQAKNSYGGYEREMDYVYKDDIIYLLGSLNSKGEVVIVK